LPFSTKAEKAIQENTKKIKGGFRQKEKESLLSTYE